MLTRLRILAQAGRSPRIQAVGGLDARLTGADTVHVIGTAATPLGGDTIEITLCVGPGAVLRVRTVAAGIALPGRHALASAAHWRIDVAAGGTLDLDPHPTVIAGAGQHDSAVFAEIDPAATVRIVERAQVGRAGERDGRWSGELLVNMGEVPLVHHRLELGPGTVADDLVGAPRAVVSEFRYPDTRAVQATLDFARLPLAGGGTLATWTGARLSDYAALPEE